MKKMRWLAMAVAALAGVGVLGNRARAADHTDGPAVTSDPTTDITDLFVWTDQTDNTKVDLIMNVFPAAGTSAQFSNTAKYVFHISPTSAYPVPATSSKDVICTFDNGTPQLASCWIGTDDYVTGDATDPATPLVAADGKFQVFTGLRDDPFYFNLDGFKAVEGAVHAAVTQAGGPPWAIDAAGCPAIDTGTTGFVANTLATNPADAGVDGAGGPAVDHFAGLNVLSIVIQADASLLGADSTHPILGVWGSTNQ